MTTIIYSNILFNDAALLDLSGHFATSPIAFGDCNNRFEPEIAGDNKLNDAVMPDDILFNDTAIITAKFGQQFLTGGVANANCDCGR